MITLPSSIKIDRVEKGEKWLLDKSRAWVEKAGGDRSKETLLHASDCLDPRLAYFQRKYPQPIADRLIPIFLIGRVLHAFVINAVEGTVLNWEADGGSIVSKELGITYSPDMLINGVPREIKTSRAFYEPRDIKDLSMYCEQLLIYMAGQNTTKGDLWVLFMNAKSDGQTSPAFRVYRVTITPEDLKKVQAQIKGITKKFHAVQKSGKFRELPLCRLFKCKGCEYYEKCKPEGRYGVPKTRWIKDDENPLVQIVPSKVHAGHGKYRLKQ